MRIESTIAAVHSNKLLKATNNSLSKSTDRLSSGKSINRAADNAAGLAISEKLKAQMTSLNRAAANAYDGISMIKTAEGALNNTHAALQDMRELALQASNATLSEVDRNALQAQANQLSKDIDSISENTEFNTQKLLDGSLADGFKLQIDPNAVAGGNASSGTEVNLQSFSAEALGVADLDLTTAEGAAAAIEAIDNAIDTVTSQRVDLGSVQNRIEYSVNNLSIASENLMAANSQIADVDMAEEFSELTRQSILQEANLAMQAQANRQSSQILNLLR
jgi:flagellin